MKSKIKKHFSYANLMNEVYNLKHWRPKEIVSLDYMFSAANHLGIKYQGKEKLGNKFYPQFIHITGTNGKGSVAKKISSALIDSGIKTGCYISPHISSFLERITINDEFIEKSFVENFLTNLLKLNKEKIIDVSFFDAMTLLMFKYFEEKHVEVAVIEVGCGGTYDSTNIINPLISIITSISLDHVNVLGNTKELIAENKSGIIKNKGICIVGPNCEPFSVFLKKCKETDSELVNVRNFMKFDYNSGVDFELENSLTARISLEQFQSKYNRYFGNKLTTESIIKGLTKKQPCRMEDVFEVNDNSKKTVSKLFESNNKLIEKIAKKFLKIYLDVGHNEDGISKVLNEIQEKYDDFKLNIVCGFSSGKDLSEMICKILKYKNLKSFFLSTCSHPRICKKNEYEGIIKSIDKNDYLFEVNKIIIGDIKENIKNVITSLTDNNEKEIILVIGSFFIMKDARMILGYNDYVDEFDFQEKPINI